MKRGLYPPPRPRYPLFIYLYSHSFTPSCIHLPSFTFIHPQLPHPHSFSPTFLHLLSSAFILPQLPSCSSTFIRIHSSPVAFFSLYPHSFTRGSLRLSAFIPPQLPSSTLICIHLSTVPFLSLYIRILSPTFAFKYLHSRSFTHSCLRLSVTTYRFCSVISCNYQSQGKSTNNWRLVVRLL